MSSPETPIPKDEAMKLCSEIRKENGIKLYSQCWGCMRFSKGDSEKMCFSSEPDNRGCRLVNKQYDSLFKT